MKKIKIFFAIMAVATTINIAQGQVNIAHIDTEALINSMPEKQKMDVSLSKMMEQQTQELQARTGELMAKINEYHSTLSTLSDAVKATKMQEFEDQKQALIELEKRNLQQIAEKRKELLMPIKAKALSAINEVANKLGFVYVLDSSTLAVANGKNLMPEVKSTLGID